MITDDDQDNFGDEPIPQIVLLLLHHQAAYAKHFFFLFDERLNK